MTIKSEPIRILCVFSWLDRGGAETMCMNLYRNIDRNKVQFDFVKHTNKKCDYEDEIRSLGGRIYTAPRYKGVNKFTYEKWWKRHFKNHPEHKIIHGHYFSIADVYFKVSHQNNAITIGHSHNTFPAEKRNIFNRVKHIFAMHHVLQLEKESDYCFACSQAAGEWVFKNKSFKVLNNSIDTKLFAFSTESRNKIRQELGLQDVFVIGTVGRIVTQKNPLGIVQIFNEVLKLNSNARLLWVGTYDTDMGRKAIELAEHLGICDKIIFTGVVDNVNEMLQAMDCFILPSFYEGLPVVAVEAQAAGMRCFLSNTITDEVNITNNCKMLPLNEPKLWAKEILKDNKVREDTSQQIINAGYDIHTTAKWLEDFYLSINI